VLFKSAGAFETKDPSPDAILPLLLLLSRFTVSSFSWNSYDIWSILWIHLLLHDLLHLFVQCSKYGLCRSSRAAQRKATAVQTQGTQQIFKIFRDGRVFRVGIKKPTQKNPKKPHKKPTKNGFFGFFGFF
jgi:hypothetical protein